MQLNNELSKKLINQANVINDYFKLQRKEINKIIKLKTNFALQHASQTHQSIFQDMQDWTKGGHFVLDDDALAKGDKQYHSITSLPETNKYFTDFIGLDDSISVINHDYLKTSARPKLDTSPHTAYTNGGVSKSFIDNFNRNFQNEYATAIINLIRNFLKRTFMPNLKNDMLPLPKGLENALNFSQIYKDSSSVINAIDKWWDTQEPNTTIPKYFANKVAEKETQKEYYVKNMINKELWQFVKDDFSSIKPVGKTKIKIFADKSVSIHGTSTIAQKILALFIYLDEKYQRNVPDDEKFSWKAFNNGGNDNNRLLFNYRIYNNGSIEIRLENNYPNKYTQKELNQDREILLTRLNKLYDNVINHKVNKNDIVFNLNK